MTVWFGAVIQSKHELVDPKGTNLIEVTRVVFTSEVSAATQDVALNILQSLFMATDAGKATDFTDPRVKTVFKVKNLLA